MSYGYSNNMARLIKQKHEEDPADPLFALGALCVDRDIVPSTIAERVHVSKQAVYDWFQQRYSPKPETVDEIKAYLKELRKTKG